MSTAAALDLEFDVNEARSASPARGRGRGMSTTTTALTYSGRGLEEARAQLGMAKAMLDNLVAGLGELLDGERDLADRVGQINEVLATAVRVAAVDPAGSADRGVCDLDRLRPAHHDSPPVVGNEPTVGAPDAACQPVASGTCAVEFMQFGIRHRCAHLDRHHSSRHECACGAHVPSTAT